MARVVQRQLSMNTLRQDNSHLTADVLAALERYETHAPVRRWCFPYTIEQAARVLARTCLDLWHTAPGEVRLTLPEPVKAAHHLVHAAWRWSIGTLVVVVGEDDEDKDVGVVAGTPRMVGDVIEVDVLLDSGATVPVEVDNLDARYEEE